MADAAENGATLDPSASADFVQGFRTLKSRAQGRLVRLSSVSDEILQGHDYPDSVCTLLGEALGLTALLGATLGRGGKLILQTKTDGPAHLVVVNTEPPAKLRGYVGFDIDNVSASEENWQGIGALLGNGHLGLTIDNGTDAVRYQGIVALENASLTDGALAYFRQSEQIPTFIKIAVARRYGPRESTQETGNSRPWQWSVGGLIVQQLPLDVAGRPERPADVDDEADPADDEDWQRVQMLAATVEDHELLDPTLTAEQLLYRLFAEEDVVAFTPVPASVYCQCSRQRVEMLLRSFGPEELEDLKEPDGAWSVKCEFCSTSFRFTPDDLETGKPQV